MRYKVTVVPRRDEWERRWLRFLDVVAVCMVACGVALLASGVADILH